MADNDLTECRAAFEKFWAEYGNDSLMKRSGVEPDSYASTTTKYAWLGWVNAWKAGALAMRAAAAKVAEHPNAGLDAPDGGSPTPREMLLNVSATIRSIDPATLKGE